VAQILLEHGADVSVKTSSGDSVLHLVFVKRQMAGWEAIVRSLLLNGADVSSRDKNGRTPLHQAVFQDSVEALKLLLEHGADISATECGGSNVLYWAVEKHNVEFDKANRRGIAKAVEMIQILLAHGTDVHTKIADLSATTDAGKTPAEVACTEDLKEMMRSALLRAEKTRRAMLEAFTMGQHKRLGAAARILPLSSDVVQMIMDRV